jgi:hypothetical protein
MHTSRILSILCILLLAGLLPGTALAYATPDSIVAAGKVYVSNVTLDPGTFFPGDRGTISYEIANGAADQGIVVNHASLLSNDKVRQTSEAYRTSTHIGPALASSTGGVLIPQTKTFTFSVIADGQDGIYYPTFSLSFRDADSLYHRQPVRIDSTPLLLTVKDRPDAFSKGQKKTIYLQVANPRKNTVKNVILRVSGQDAELLPSEIFIGSIGPGEKVPVNFSVTPGSESPLTMTLDYYNGDNLHTVTMELPVVFGTDKKAAEPVMSNVQVNNNGGIWHVTGDVNNAGLETANTVIVTALSPAIPEDPYKVYVVGALKPDDFGSFEITFSAENAETVPVKLSYKDADGNVYDTVQDVRIGASGITVRADGETPSMLPVAAAGIVVVVLFVGGWAYYLRRNKK